MPYSESPAFYWSQFSRGNEDPYAPPSLRGKDIAQKRRDIADGALNRMIEQHDELYAMREAEVVVPLLERWRLLDAMGATEEKQSLLEPLIQQVQRSPEEHEGELIFVLLVFEPIRRSVCARLLRGVPLGAGEAEPEKHRRHEARVLRDLERQEFFDATRAASLELIHGYTFNVDLGRLFAWFRETLSWRVLELYRREYLSENCALGRYESEYLARFLLGVNALEPPETQRPGYKGWRQSLGDLRPVYAAIDDYRERPEVRRVCRDAVNGLSPRRRDTILAYYYDGLSLEQIAERQSVSISTVGNAKNQAEKRLRQDDLFYCALDALGKIRSEARRQEIAVKYPDGVRPDGKRIVWIGG